MTYGLRWLVWCALLAGCLEDNLVLCADGTACPAGATCHATLGCITDEQVVACATRLDGDQCELASGAGTCLDRACIVPRCGDGVVQPGEVCDDRNTLSGDGCSGTCTSDESCGNGVLELVEACDCGTSESPNQTAFCASTINGGALCRDDCTLRRCGDGIPDPSEVCDDGNLMFGDGCSVDCASEERCGNGVIDYLVGELCEDGDLEDLDGCSSTCRVEELVWRPQAQGIPAGSESTLIVTDFAHQRVLLHVANSNPPQTWQLSRKRWTQLAPERVPGLRYGAAIAYDTRRGRAVLFGGSRGALTDETWELDDDTWILRTPPNRPSPRMDVAMAYDVRRGRVVMFGGYDSQGSLAETWEWDGTTWEQRLTASSPATINRAPMAYDAARGRIVLHRYDGETWEYNGQDWSLVTSSGPAGYGDWSLGFDPASGKLVLFGGLTDTGYVEETSVLDGASWSSAVLTPSPPGRSIPGMFVDPESGALAIFGGTDQSVGFLTDLWSYEPTKWSSIATVAAPEARYGAGVSYDPLRGRTVLFGGERNYSDPLQDTWEHDENGWFAIAASGAPPVRSGHGMTFDGRRTVMFGGRNQNQMLAPLTWMYDGQAWSSVAGSAPGVRYGTAMAYDPVRDRVVLFGGRDAFDYLTDTWEWNGATSTWSKVTTSTMTPEARDTPSLVYDPNRGRIVMFGGALSGNAVNSTWEFDGAQWIRTPALSPGRAHPASMFHELHNAIVSWGGFGNPGGFYAQETWELTPSGWSELLLARSPAAGESVGVYEATSARATVFVHDGTGATWTLGYERLDDGEACRSGRDLDGDSKIGCDDLDCAHQCDRCGDGNCDLYEDCRSCPADCAVGVTCVPICGDEICDPGETTAACKADC